MIHHNEGSHELGNGGLTLKAAYFAAEKHRCQRRKDPERTPYINHPLEVANILWFEGDVRDPRILAAALLHDTVEDTDASFEEIDAEFGSTVADLVAEVTDDTRLKSRERKQAQVAKAPYVSQNAKLIKLADKISNLRDIMKAPPEGWSLQRQAAYFQWAQQVVEGMGPVHPSLDAAFRDVFQEFFDAQEAEAELGRVTG